MIYSHLFADWVESKPVRGRAKREQILAWRSLFRNRSMKSGNVFKLFGNAVKKLWNRINWCPILAFHLTFLNCETVSFTGIKNFWRDRSFCIRKWNALQLSFHKVIVTYSFLVIWCLMSDISHFEIRVVEKRERRVRIDSPTHEWVLLYTNDGWLI